MGRTHTLNVPGSYANIRQVCEFVAAGAVASGLDETAVFHIELACDEACTNIIEHGYGGEGIGNISVSWQIIGSNFTITLKDNGRSFKPENVPKPPLTTTDTPPPTEDLKVGGLGIHFMRKLMDDITFTFDQTNGNTLTMIKTIPEDQPS